MGRTSFKNRHLNSHIIASKCSQSRIARLLQNTQPHRQPPLAASPQQRTFFLKSTTSKNYPPPPSSLSTIFSHSYTHHAVTSTIPSHGCPGTPAHDNPHPTNLPTSALDLSNTLPPLFPRHLARVLTRSLSSTPINTFRLNRLLHLHPRRARRNPLPQLPLDALQPATIRPRLFHNLHPLVNTPFGLPTAGDKIMRQCCRG